MIFEEIVEVLDRFFEIPTLVEDSFWYFDERALFVGDDGGASGNIIDEGHFSKGVSRIVVDVLFLPPFL